MKNIICALMLVGFAAFALDDIELPKGGSFYDGKTLQPQYDSTTDTVSSVYTPRYVGDFLVGQTTGSNSLWVACGLTTTDWSIVTSSGGPYSADDIEADAVTESKLKAVDAATDEDVLTYEETTGDFEWHSVAQIIAQMAAGGLPNDSILEADLKAVDSASDEDFLSYEATTGDFEWHSAAEIQGKFTEGSYADSTIVSADIKDGEIVNADVSASAAIAHTKLAAIEPGYLLVGNATSQAVAVAVSGDVTLATNGVATVANDAIETAMIGVIHQADAADETTNSLYTPGFIGQVLIGFVGPGTNSVWISKGTTTNDWVLVAP